VVQVLVKAGQWPPPSAALALTRTCTTTTLATKHTMARLELIGRHANPLPTPNSEEPKRNY